MCVHTHIHIYISATETETEPEKEGEAAGRVVGLFPVMHRDIEGKNKYAMREKNAGDTIRGSAPEFLPGEEVG